MSTFDELRTTLNSARADRRAAREALAAKREELGRTESELRAAMRAGDADRIAEISSRRDALARGVTAGAAALRGLDAAVLAHARGFGEVADPRKQIGELDDHVPILLLPLRLETRFRLGELWIRAYPDDCHIDSFEATPTESELASMRAFWIAWWRAGGVEAQQRGAWRAFVGATGSGRAAHLIAQYKPTAAAPTKARAGDVLLVIVPTIAVTGAEQAAAFTYWLAVWAAHGDPRLEPPARAALAAAVGDARASEIIAGFAPDPAGWEPPKPATRATVTAACVVLELPPAPPTRATSWTAPPRATCLPDRLVALLYRGGDVRAVVGSPIPDSLAVTPDPSLPEGEQIGVVDGDLVLDDELRWIGDFERAVAIGMGLRVVLEPAEVGGFDRVIVVGLRLSATAAEGARELARLVEHQLASKLGFGLVPQGSPTNNTEAGATPYSWIDDPGASFDRVFLGKEAYVESSDPLERRDGEWLARALDLPPDLVRRMPHANATDQREARAMNIALWNATFGYALEDMCASLFSRADIAATRSFFTTYVSGRGPLPAIRVAKQPYGILPVLAFSRFRSGEQRATYLGKLHGVLARMDTDWKAMAASASHVGATGDPHQILLDVVGLHPGSVEFHQRYAESLDQLYNKLTMQGGGLLGGLLAAWLANRGRDLLARLGANPDVAPPILEKFFFGTSPLLSGPIVDDVPLSETAAIRACTPDGANYIEWLAASSLDVIRRQDFGGNDEPRALLYLMLRHAMMLGHWDAGTRLLERHHLVDPAVARSEPAFIHVQAQGGGESKLEHLIRTQPLITGDTSTTLAEYVRRPSVLATAAETVDLRALIDALERLAQVPTARLERLFAEHVDLATYRLDAWKTGLAALRLAELRDPERRQPGLYLGAYGWLEDVRPRAATVPVELGGEIAEVFARETDPPLVRDPQSAGYIHAPSLDHAATAAILKNAYAVNATPAQPDAFAVNLSSSRVRQALAVLEGMRNGQSLAALLGYRFERGLHDSHDLAEVDKLVYPLRQAFPLVANKLSSTRDATADITLVEARNVIDGLALVEHVTRSGSRSYPFGLATLPAASSAERRAVDAEVDRLLDLHDALGDLTLAESVYQVVRGNFDRAAAVTTASQSGARPPEIEVVDTPRNGVGLQHRVALHCDPSADPATSPNTVPMTPRARAEAPLNLWLSERLPDPDTVGIAVAFTTPVDAAGSTTITLRDLGLQAIDLLYLGDLELQQAMAELDDRVVQLVRYGTGAHPAMKVEIRYPEPAGTVSLFELAPLLRSLRTLVLHSRALTATDLVMPLEAGRGEATFDDADLTARIAASLATLTARRDALVGLQTDGSPLDDFARLVSDELLAIARWGIPQTGTGHIHRDVRAIYEAAAGKLAAVVEYWDRRAADFDALLLTYPALTTDEERFALLRRAELCVRAAGTLSPPALALYKADVEAARVQLGTSRDQLAALATWSGTRLEDFLADVHAALPLIAQHAPTPVDIDAQRDAATRLRETLVGRVTQLAADLTARIAAAQQGLVEATALADPGARYEALRAAAKHVLGEDVVVLPRFRLAAGRANELVNAFAASTTLLTDLVASGRRFPVDDWLHGVARVRDKLTAWESAAIFGEVLGAAPAPLVPIQLPHAANDRWAALEIDLATAGSHDRLLYTAHVPAGFTPHAVQCGLVIDEWPEVIPVLDVMTGLAFHFDRPSAQPPQVMLLALPAAVRGRWTWDDLVGAITETLDGAKSRAVEPSHVDGSAYGQFLPATLMAVTLYWITIATNLALNNAIYDHIGAS